MSYQPKVLHIFPFACVSDASTVTEAGQPEKSLETREIWFWHTDPTTTSEIADETIDVAAFDMKSWKLLEVSILKNKTCRAIGVRGSEQVYIWEKTAVQKEP